MGKYAIQKLPPYDLLRNFTVGGTPLTAGTVGAYSYTSRTNLLSWWRFENSYDSSGNEFNLQYAAAAASPTRSTSNPGFVSSYSLEFEALSNQYATVPNSTGGNFTFNDGSRDKPFSFAMWISPSAVGAVLGKGTSVADNEYFLSITPSLIVFGMGNSGASLQWLHNTWPLFWNAGPGWRHLVITYDGRGATHPGAAIRVYMDGSELTSTILSDNNYVGMSNSSSPLWIGRYYLGAVGDLTGKLADFAVWDKALKHEEVTALYLANTDTSLYKVSRNYGHQGSYATNSGSINQFRQGVSVLTMQQRYIGMTPKLAAGSSPIMLLNGQAIVRHETFFDETMTAPKTAVVIGNALTQSSTNPLNSAQGTISFVPNHQMVRRDFGQPKLFKDDEPYEDMAGFNPVAFLEDVGGTMIYPYILWNVSMRDPDQMDGAIEPLAIRSRASRNSIDWPYEAHRVSGFWIDGAEDSRHDSCPIIQQINLKSTNVEPYEDGGYEFFGQTVEGAIRIEGFLHNDPSSITPWLDETDRAEAFSALNRTGNGPIYNAELVMTGSIDDLNERDHKSATAGFVYFGAEGGTDSLAFGGLKK